MYIKRPVSLVAEPFTVKNVTYGLVDNVTFYKKYMHIPFNNTILHTTETSDTSSCV